MKFSWQKWTLLAAIIVVMCIEAVFFSGFSSLNSPVYGGDIYYHFGVSNHIFNGGSPFMSSQFLGEYAHYPWLYHYIVASLASITGISLQTVVIFFPLLITFFAGIISFWLGVKVFKDETLALLFSLYWITVMIPNSLPAPFASVLVFPLFVLMIYYYSDSWFGKISSGVLLGITALSHTSVFLGSLIFFFILSFIKIKENWKQGLVWGFTIGTLGLIVSMLYWYAPFFIYHGITPNRWADYVASGDTFTFQILFNLLKNQFFNLNNFARLFLGLFALLGITYAFRKDKNEIDYLPFYIYLAGFIGFIHPLITLPLLGTSVGSYGFDNIFILAIPLLILISFQADKSFSKQTNKIKTFCMIILTFLFLSHAFFVIQGFKNDIWTQSAENPEGMPVKLQGLISWSKENIENNESILVSADETGFAINALTGKKVVTARRTHSSPFVNMNERNADTAVLLYGNNTKVKKELISKYQISWFYEDAYAVQAQQECRAYIEQKLNDFYSVRCLRTTPEYESYLKENGVEYVKSYAGLDPASSVAPLFDLLSIKPTNYTFQVSELSYDVPGIARMYKVIK